MRLKSKDDLSFSQSAHGHVTAAEQLVAETERALAAAKAQLAKAQSQLQVTQEAVVTANEQLATAKDRIRRTQPLVVRAAEAAKMLSLSHSALYSLLMSGDVKSFKVGSRRLIPVRALEEFVARRMSDEW